MARLLSLFVAVFLLLCPPAHAGNVSGLPVPRFVSLKSGEVNVRSGPGTRYPIQWVYRRDNMPVEVVEEFDVWRKIRDSDGTAGWVHKTMLEGKRNVMIRGKEAHIVRENPDADSKPLLKAEPTVIARLLQCQKDWCRIQLGNRKGWLEKRYLWGVYVDELIE